MLSHSYIIYDCFFHYKSRVEQVWQRSDGLQTPKVYKLQNKLSLLQGVNIRTHRELRKGHYELGPLEPHHSLSLLILMSACCERL